jgi:hypothetical protein
MSSTETVLVVGFGSAARELSGRLLLVHYRGRNLETLEEAAGDVRDARAAIVHSSLDDEAGLRTLARAGSDGPLPLVASGPRPGKNGLRALRGVALAVFEPFHDAELRFVLNQAMHEEASSRVDVRVPTPLDATAVGGTGEKRVSVYNLSRGGAFLETMRPSAEGGRITLRLPLPGGGIEVQAQVVTTNVPGNLQRPNLPMGMGVRFQGLSDADARAISSYVSERNAAYRV